jgi:hypothetical protein
VHVLLIHQAFAALDEPGGTRHHELARFLVEKGHRVTILASPVSYLTGKARSGAPSEPEDSAGLTIRRVYTYPALHRSFAHRVISFLSFMLSAFIAGLRVPDVDVVWGTSPPIFQVVTAWALARLKRVPFLLEVRDLWPDFAIAVGCCAARCSSACPSGWSAACTAAPTRCWSTPGFIDHVSGRGGEPPGSQRLRPTHVRPCLSGGNFADQRPHPLRRPVRRGARPLQ